VRHWLTYTFPILGDSDKATRKRIHDAFGAWGGVLDAAFKSLNDKDDKTFDRWFPEKAGNNDGREYVKGVFGQLFDSSTAGPKAVIAGLINEATDVTGTCAKNAATKAYMLSYSGRFHICAPGLSQSTLPTDNKCKDLGNAVSTKMNMLTGHSYLMSPSFYASLSKVITVIPSIERHNEFVLCGTPFVSQRVFQ